MNVASECHNLEQMFHIIILFLFYLKFGLAKRFIFIISNDHSGPYYLLISTLFIPTPIQSLRLPTLPQSVGLILIQTTIQLQYQSNLRVDRRGWRGKVFGQTTDPSLPAILFIFSKTFKCMLIQYKVLIRNKYFNANFSKHLNNSQAH